MANNKVETFTATIYCGLRNRDTGCVHPVSYARELLQKYTDAVGLCVTLTETEYIYTRGSEKGIIVGLINYPRFPSSTEKIKQQALLIAEILMLNLEQYRVTVVFPDLTVMLSNPKLVGTDEV